MVERASLRGLGVGAIVSSGEGVQLRTAVVEHGERDGDRLGLEVVLTRDDVGRLSRGHRRGAGEIAVVAEDNALGQGRLHGEGGEGAIGEKAHGDDRLARVGSDGGDGVCEHCGGTRLAVRQIRLLELAANAHHHGVAAVERGTTRGRPLAVGSGGVGRQGLTVHHAGRDRDDSTCAARLVRGGDGEGGLRNDSLDGAGENAGGGVQGQTFGELRLDGVGGDDAVDGGCEGHFLLVDHAHAVARAVAEAGGHVERALPVLIFGKAQRGQAGAVDETAVAHAAGLDGLAVNVGGGEAILRRAEQRGALHAQVHLSDLDTLRSGGVDLHAVVPVGIGVGEGIRHVLAPAALGPTETRLV